MHAQHRVCPRHRAGAEDSEQVASRECQLGTTRFAGKETVASRRDRSKQPGKLPTFEMVQEQVGDDQVPACHHATTPPLSNGSMAPAAQSKTSPTLATAVQPSSP